MSDEIFTPFTPAAPPLSPAAEPLKRQRKARADKGAKRERAVKAAVADPQAAVPTPPWGEAPPARKKRKPRAVASVRKPRSMKLPVDTMLSALSSLKGDDGALFEKLLGILNAAGKPQRTRVMAALGKVFS